MGNCCGTKVDHAKSAGYMADFRKDKPEPFQTLIMGIKDQNMTGKVYLSGPGSSDAGLQESVGQALAKTNSGVRLSRMMQEYDVMWDVAWHNTKLTSGVQAFSFTKPYFPRGKAIVELLDSLAKHGWVPTAGPNFGGPISDKASADWPCIIFGKDDGRYTPNTLLMAIKDQNVPGKLCVAGPPDEVARLKEPLLQALQEKCGSSVKSEFDEYDTNQDWDAVFLNTSLTSGAAALSFAKPYFPKGKAVMGFLEAAYRLGWRLVAAPNFGGNNVDWPCFIFRQLVSPPSDTPGLLMAAIKDQNQPGKICLAGADARTAAEAISKALNEKASQSTKVEKDEYDDDHNEVVRNTSMTTGAFTFGLSYFPKCRPMMTMLNTMNDLGWRLAAAPNYGGMDASWPSFIWEKRDEPVKSAFVAIKDQNIPGKVCIGGVGQNEALRQALLKGLGAVTVEPVHEHKDSWDTDFDMSFKNTAMTTGSQPMSFQNAWFPYGFPLEIVVSEMAQQGYRAVGGPNFGAGKLSWSALVFETSGEPASETPAQVKM